MTGSSVQLRDETVRLREELQRDSKRDACHQDKEAFEEDLRQELCKSETRQMRST